MVDGRVPHLYVCQDARKDDKLCERREKRTQVGESDLHSRPHPRTLYDARPQGPRHPVVSAALLKQRLPLVRSRGRLPDGMRHDDLPVDEQTYPANQGRCDVEDTGTET